jgi:hypothetical protein
MLFDFGTVYNYTFERTRYIHILVDYSEEPAHFEYYTKVDQELIRQLLAEIRANQT